MDILLLQIPLFVIELILLILFDKKNVNKAFRVCVLVAVVLQIGLFGFDKYLQYEYSQYGGNLCSESICGTEKDKKGFVKCKHYEDNNVVREVKCHASDDN